MKKHLIALTVMLLACLSALAVQAFEKVDKTEIIKADQPIIPPAMSEAQDTCSLSYHWVEDTILGYSSGYEFGHQTVTYFDPGECGWPTYPFEISGVSMVLLDPPNVVDPRTYQWPVTIDIVVYDLQFPPDSCYGPGDELCRQQVVCDSATFNYPNTGTVTFDNPCCVLGPVFVGIEYVDPDTGQFYPSIMFEASNRPDTCHMFYYCCDSWYGWYAYWVTPPGYPFFWVHGETASLTCCTDADEDLVCDQNDNCPNDWNPSQEDMDGDGVGDMCDNCPHDENPDQYDQDFDDVGEVCDNCPQDPNTNQSDIDNDGLGDVCDVCPDDSTNDVDHDYICGLDDNCPTVYNPGQEDDDQDGVGNVCETVEECIGDRGNVDGMVGDVIDIADLVYLVDFMFNGGPPPPSMEEADVDASGQLDIADLVYLVDYMFNDGAAPLPCR
jgi:hypothetical protein